MTLVDALWLPFVERTEHKDLSGLEASVGAVTSPRGQTLAEWRITACPRSDPLAIVRAYSISFSGTLKLK